MRPSGVAGPNGEEPSLGIPYRRQSLDKNRNIFYICFINRTEELAGGETRKRMQRKEGRERAGDIWHNRRREQWGQSEFFIFSTATF